MAINNASPEDSGQWRTYGKDPETKARIRFKVGTVDPDDRRKILNEELLRNRKKKALANMSAMESAAHAEAIGKRRAHLSLIDSENFEIRFIGRRREEKRSTLPAGLTMAEDGLVKFDGLWTPAVKEFVFGLMPGIVDFVNNKSDEMSEAEEADEEDTVASFR